MFSFQSNLLTSLLSENEVKEEAKRVRSYLQELITATKDEEYGMEESPLALLFDVRHKGRVEEVAREKTTGSLKYVIVIGIGGSNLGAQAVYEAVYGKRGEMRPNGVPALLFVDTINPREGESIIQLLETSILKPEELLINVITKSGKTTETLGNFGALFAHLQTRFGDAIKERLVVTTNEGSSLFHEAKKQKISTLSIPEQVGGRFSVFSAVGLFPLHVAGVNIVELLRGAQEGRDASLLSEVDENPALFYAISAYLHHKKGIRILNHFFFHSELESVGKWLRQLFAESLGKRYNRDGETIRSGLTPIVSIGSTDLHSMAQLYFGGPRDKLTQFIYASGGQEGRISVPERYFFDEMVPDVAGKDFSTIMDAIRGGVAGAYAEAGLPYSEYALSEISERELGLLMQTKMIEVMILGKLWNINAFDQPEVEHYKIKTKELLSRVQ